MKAIVFLADGFEECEALIVVDILRRAGVEVVMASIMGRLEVESSRLIVVKANTLAENIADDNADLVFLPGGRRGTENLKKSNIVRETCIQFAKNRIVAAICAAPSLLAEFGLLEGREATCHPDFEQKMRGAILTGNSVSKAGSIITGQGLGSTFEFAFELVKLLVGQIIVDKIKNDICY